MDSLSVTEQIEIALELALEEIIDKKKEIEQAYQKRNTRRKKNGGK